MLTNFYLVAVVPLGLGTLISALLKNREFGRRGLTLFILIHLICLMLWYQPPGFSVLVMGILAIGIGELTQYYPITYPGRAMAFGVGGLSFALLTYYTFLLPVVLPFYYAISVMCFVARSSWIRHPTFMIGFIILVLSLAAACLVHLANRHIQNIIVVILLLQLNDIFSLLFGKLLGKRRLFKVLSPNKTLEGYLIGGVGILIGLVLLHTVIPVFESFRWAQSAIILAYFWVFGNLGDLLFSSLKRHLQIKDFSELLPGHGGVLDRFDNTLFVAPGYYLMISFGLSKNAL